jgi:hypothetical protein
MNAYSRLGNVNRSESGARNLYHVFKIYLLRPAVEIKDNKDSGQLARAYCITH